MSLATSVCPCRARRAAGQATCGAGIAFDRPPEETTRKDVAERPTCRGVSYRTLDAATHRGGDREAIGGDLHTCQCMVSSEADGLVVSKARTSCSRTQRRSHRALAKKGLATHKKKQEEPHVVSFFLTKPGLCCSRWFVAPGPRKAKRPFITAGTDATACRSSLPSLFRQGAGDSVCTSTSLITTSSPTILKGLSNRCCVSEDAESSWCWIVGACIAPGSGDCNDVFKSDCVLNGCRLMPPTSTQRSRCGTGRSGPTWVTFSQTTRSTFGAPSVVRCAIPRLNKNCCVRSLSMRNSNYSELLYLFNDQ